MSSTKITRLIYWVSGILATVVALSLPSIYFAQAYQNLRTAISTETQIQASMITQMVNSNPEMWRYETTRLETALLWDVRDQQAETRRILDPQHKLIAVRKAHLDAPTLTLRENIYDAGVPVGQVEITRSWRPLLIQTAYVGLLGIALGLLTFFCLSYFPMRALRTALDSLFKAQEHSSATLTAIGEAVIRTDAQALVEYLNPAAEVLLGCAHSAVQGQPVTALFSLIGYNGAQAENPVLRILQGRTIVCIGEQLTLVRGDGQKLTVTNNSTPVYDQRQHIVGAVLVLHDLSESLALKAQLEYQSSHDLLTGLGNRFSFEQQLGRAIQGSQSASATHVLCYVDLDQFKIINDTCGHVAGDELLKQIAKILQFLLRPQDTLARLGGDEFGILLERCALSEAALITEALLQAIRLYRFDWEDKQFRLSASIGLVLISAESEQVSDLLSLADATCYVAKDKGRNRVQIYQADDGEMTRRHGEMHWVTRIHRALEENRFCLYQQTILSLQKTDPHEQHFEVLLRMIDEQGQIIPPNTFIPAAERYNLMPLIDRWVIQNSFAAVARLGRQSPKTASICAINLSGASLTDEALFDFIAHNSRLHQIAPQSICFEITETAAIANLKQAIAFMNELKTLGFQFSLDDFGSGLSSFAYLKNMPVDYLKIDGSFVRDILDDHADHAMVNAINQVGHVMGLKTVAEFVENKQILARLEGMGVDYGQGYGIAKPQPLESNIVPLFKTS